MKPTNFVSVMAPTLVYVGVSQRTEFDRIAVEAEAFEKVLVKHVEENGVRVIFQHWLQANSTTFAAATAPQAT